MENNNQPQTQNKTDDAQAQKPEATQEKTAQAQKPEETQQKTEEPQAQKPEAPQHTATQAQKAEEMETVGFAWIPEDEEFLVSFRGNRALRLNGREVEAALPASQVRILIDANGNKQLELYPRIVSKIWSACVNQDFLQKTVEDVKPWDFVAEFAPAEGGFHVTTQGYEGHVTNEVAEKALPGRMYRALSHRATPTKAGIYASRIKALTGEDLSDGDGGRAEGLVALLEKGHKVTL